MLRFLVVDYSFVICFKDSYIVIIIYIFQGINDLCWTFDSLFVCSCSDDKTLKIWDVRLVRFVL